MQDTKKQVSNKEQSVVGIRVLPTSKSPLVRFHSLILLQLYSQVVRSIKNHLAKVAGHFKLFLLTDVNKSGRSAGFHLAKPNLKARTKHLFFEIVKLKKTGFPKCLGKRQLNFS